MMMSAGASTSEDIGAVEEKTEFDVSLDEVPKDEKIPILKVVRSVNSKTRRRSRRSCCCCCG